MELGTGSYCDECLEAKAVNQATIGSYKKNIGIGIMIGQR